MVGTSDTHGTAKRSRGRPSELVPKIQYSCGASSIYRGHAAGLGTQHFTCTGTLQGPLEAGRVQIRKTFAKYVNQKIAFVIVSLLRL